MKDAVSILKASTFLAPGENGVVDAGAEQPEGSALRDMRLMGDGFVERLAILNHSNERQTIDIKLEVAANFADLFEVKDALPQKGEYYRCMRAGRLVLADEIRQLHTRTLLDIAALCSNPEVLPDHSIAAAGIPWKKTRVVAEQPGPPTYDQVRSRMIEQRSGFKAERAIETGREVSL